MDLSTAISRAAAETAQVVERVNPVCFTDPSPCSEWDVRTLASHMVGFAGLSIAAAAKTEYDPVEFDVDGWQQRYAELADELAEAWSVPGALDGTTSLGGPEIEARRAAALTLQELVLHGWDLAAAIGVEYAPSPEVAAAVRTVVERGAENARSVGAYGPPVDAPEGSDDFAAALAESGRTPEWTAG